MNNNMLEAPKSPTTRRDWATRIQIHGVLLKKSFGNTSNKWTKRFFLVKDGYLMYYDANEKKDYDKRDFFNIHPKGALPLGECCFREFRDSQQPFCIQIDSPEIAGQLVLSAESQYERDQWLEVLECSRRVTWKSTQLGDEMIRNLEKQGLEMAIEKQDYIDRLQSEIQALSDEKMKSEELERVNHELEIEKKKLESFTKDMQDEYEKIKSEMTETADIMKQVEDDRVKLSRTLDEQSQQLESLAADKQLILSELEHSMAEQTSLAQERNSLSARSQELQAKLADIEQQTDEVQGEKTVAEHRLKDNDERLEQLEEEKSTIQQHAKELESTINDLMSQKELTEKELKEEIRARISAETRLREAEKSLTSLDKAVTSQSHTLEEEAKEEMTCSVRKLKNFFEDLATEAKMSSEAPLIIRHGTLARKTLARRAKTVRYNETKKKSSIFQVFDLNR